MQDNMVQCRIYFQTGKEMCRLSLFKKLEILENYVALPTCSQGAAAEQLNISRGCLRNILCKETALRSEALSLLLEARDRKRQHHGKSQEVEEAFSTF